jgi:hypothetical protein
MIFLFFYFVFFVWFVVCMLVFFGKKAIVKNGPKIGMKRLSSSQANESKRANLRRIRARMARRKRIISVAIRKMRSTCSTRFRPVTARLFFPVIIQ